MLDQPGSEATQTTGRTTGLLDELPLRLHHHAFVTEDHEANRHFLEDILGMPLVATWCEHAYNAQLGREIDYCHTFFACADGGCLAFFGFADPDVAAKAKATFSEMPGYWHISLKVSNKTMDDLIARADAHGLTKRVTDHGYCRSLYLATPDGMKLEFTVDPPNVAEIDRMRRADAHAELKRWLAGDHRPNNDDRPHA